MFLDRSCGIIAYRDDFQLTKFAVCFEVPSAPELHTVVHSRLARKRAPPKLRRNFAARESDKNLSAFETSYYPRHGALRRPPTTAYQVLLRLYLILRWNENTPRAEENPTKRVHSMEACNVAPIT